MRVKISLVAEKPRILPLNYNYNMASMLYRRIEKGDSMLSLYLHQPHKIKFFTFSKLMAEKRRIEGKKIRMEGNVSFFFSTPKKDIVIALVNGLLEKPEIEIAKANFVLSSIEVMREEKIKGEEIFVTLSPISVTTVKGKNGYRKIVDLYPDEEKFYENIRKNLIKKYRTLYEKEPSNDELKIEVIKAKPKRIKIKNTFHRCTEMVFRARGSVELLNIGYQAGFGERNSMGFGMVKVANGRGRRKDEGGRGEDGDGGNGK